MVPWGIQKNNICNLPSGLSKYAVNDKVPLTFSEGVRRIRLNVNANAWKLFPNLSTNLWTGMDNLPKNRLIVGRLLANLSLTSISNISIGKASKVNSWNKTENRFYDYRVKLCIYTECFYREFHPSKAPEDQIQSKKLH
jgi:hypothetical protein